MITTIASLALGLTLVAPQQGFGGPPQGGPGGPPRHMQGQRPMGPMMGNLILHPDVVKELRLSEEQVEKLRRLMPPGRGPGGPGGGHGGPGGPGGHGGPGGPGFGPGAGGPPQGQGGLGGPPAGFGPGQGGPGGQRGQGGPGGQRGPGGPDGPGHMGPNMDREIKQILSADQFKRWKQIELQLQAPASIGRPDVAERLGLTEEQREQLHEIHQGMRPPQHPQRGQEPPSREEMEKMHQQMQAHREQMLQKVLGVLTAEQREKWAAMTGKPFKLSPPQRPRD